MLNADVFLGGLHIFGGQAVIEEAFLIWGSVLNMGCLECGCL